MGRLSAGLDPRVRRFLPAGFAYCSRFVDVVGFLVRDSVIFLGFAISIHALLNGQLLFLMIL